MRFGFHLFVCFYEEGALERRYGEEYLRFKEHVPRWLPMLKPWRDGDQADYGNTRAAFSVKEK
jgi:hypothetical protein